MVSAAVPATAAFTCAILCAIPAKWHWRARNIPTLVSMFYLSVNCILLGINAIVWHDNVRQIALPYCDFVLIMLTAGGFAVPAASLCITKHLESIASPRNASRSHNFKRNKTIFDVCLCVVGPILYVGLHYIVQGHRGDIYQGVGPLNNTYWSVPGLILYYLPPLIVSTISAIYGLMTFRWLFLRRAQFRELLQGSNSGLSETRYLRLMILALAEALVFIPLYSYQIAEQRRRVGPLQAWVNWDWVHYQYDRYQQWPSAFMSEELQHVTWAFWALWLVGAFIFFAVFGCGSEAMNEYRKVGRWISTTILRRPLPTPQSSFDATLPSFVSKSRATDSTAVAQSVPGMRSLGMESKQVDSIWSEKDSMYQSDDNTRSFDLECGKLPSEEITEEYTLPSLVLPQTTSAALRPHHTRQSSDLSADVESNDSSLGLPSSAPHDIAVSDSRRASVDES